MTAGKMGRTFAAVAVLALGSAGVSNADTITQTFDHAAQTVPYTYSFTANQFNTALGTLNSVTIAFTSNIVGAVDVYNFTNADQNFSNATSSVPVVVNGPDGFSTLVTATTPGVSGTVARSPGAPTPGYTHVGGLTTTASSSSTLTNASQLATYQGSGGTPLSFSFQTGNGTYQGTAASGVAFSGSATADAHITITYNYTPNAAAVPVPASALLLGLGIIPAAVARLRRRSA